MTYLEIVNGVLTRLREDTVTTLAGSNDVVVNLVKDFVNDAKRMAEDSHKWSALHVDWPLSIVNGTDEYALTGAGKSAIITSVYSSAGKDIRAIKLSELHKKAALSSQAGTPSYYAVNGTDASGNIRLKLYPSPLLPDTITVHGYSKPADLSADDDELIIPHHSVLYLALALAARERGEVGGQTAAEIFLMADRYLSDSIALDALLSEPDNIWMTV